MAPPAATRRRSDRAFERLYRRHATDVYRYALAVLANPSDAEDVTQTTFLNAYRTFTTARNQPERPLNWLIAIAHNVCRQRFRAATRRPHEVELPTELAVAATDGAEPGFGGADIRRAFSQLTFDQRSALAMRELEGRSYREIAETLETTQSAVEALIFRARRAFREQLEGTLTCSEAERAISRQLDGELPRAEQGALRAHLRACSECRSLAHRYRAQSARLRGIWLLPLPQSLASFSGTAGGSVAAGGAALGGLGIKALALGAAALVATGVGADVASPPARSESQPGKAVTSSSLSPPVVPSARKAVTGLSLSLPSVPSAQAVHARARGLRHVSRGHVQQAVRSSTSLTTGYHGSHTGTRAHGTPAAAHLNGKPKSASSSSSNGRRVGLSAARSQRGHQGAGTASRSHAASSHPSGSPHQWGRSTATPHAQPSSPNAASPPAAHSANGQRAH